MLSITKRKKGFTLVEVMITVTVLGVIAALAIPAYQDYVTRSQVAESIALFDGKRPDAESFLTLFDGNENKFFNKTYKNGVSTNYIEASNELYGPDYKGESSYQLGYLYGKISNKPLQGKTIVFFNEKSSKDNYIWNCETNIEQRYLPSSLKCTITDGPTIGPTDPTDPEGPNVPGLPPFDGNYTTNYSQIIDPDSKDDKYRIIQIENGVPSIWNSDDVYLRDENGAYLKDEFGRSIKNTFKDPQYEVELLEIDKYGNQFYAIKKNGVLESEMGITPSGAIVEMYASTTPQEKGWENKPITGAFDDKIKLNVFGFTKNPNMSLAPVYNRTSWSSSTNQSGSDNYLGNNLENQTSKMEHGQEVMDLYNSRWNFKDVNAAADYFNNLK